MRVGELEAQDLTINRSRSQLASRHANYWHQYLLSDSHLQSVLMVGNRSGENTHAQDSALAVCCLGCRIASALFVRFKVCCHTKARSGHNTVLCWLVDRCSDDNNRWTWEPRRFCRRLLVWTQATSRSNAVNAVTPHRGTPRASVTTSIALVALPSTSAAARSV